MIALLLQALLAPTMPADTIRFGVVGDSQQQPAIFSTICQSLRADGITVFVGLGDHVQNHGQPGEWQSLFTAPMAPLSQLARYGALGNHDDIQGYTQSFWPIPQHPVSSIYGAAIACYGAVTIGNCRWVFLDTNEDPSIGLSLAPGGAQRLWLQTEVAGASWLNARYRLAAFHHPALTEQWDGGCYYPMRSERRWLMDYVSNNGGSMGLQGHAHAYQRGAWNGMPFIISGGGGGYLDTTRCWDLPEISIAIATHHYLLIDATPEALTVTAKTPAGLQIDQLVIR